MTRARRARKVRVAVMRDVFTDMNVIAEPPPGETVHREPAGFEAVDTLADRLTLHLQEDGGTYTLSIHYGNRRAALTATR